MLAASCTSDPATPRPTTGGPTPTSTVEPTRTPPTDERTALRWITRRSAPTARLEVASAVVEGELWLAGGLLGGEGSTLVEIYDPERNRWRVGPPLPVPLHHAMGASWRGSFVVIGGFIGGGFGTASPRAFRLEGEQWVQLRGLSRPRAAGGAVVIDGDIYVIGGQGGGALIAETERFDGRDWVDVAPISTPRDHLGVTTDGRFAYAVVGRRLSIDSTLTAVERYDPVRDRWRALPDAPTPRGGLAVAHVDGSIVVAGGEGGPGSNADGVFPEVEIYDIQERTWQEGPPMPTPRHGVGVGVLEGAVFVAVGGPRAGGSAGRELEAVTGL